VTCTLFVKVTKSDAGVVVASEREREEVAAATSKGTFPADYCVTCAVCILFIIFIFIFIQYLIYFICA
jgi:hypothetical protein